MSFAKYPHCYARVFVKIFWKPSMIINACDLQFFLLRKWMEIIGQAHQNVEAGLSFLTLLAFLCKIHVQVHLLQRYIPGLWMPTSSLLMERMPLIAAAFLNGSARLAKR
ncbi:unnamed protein product [Trifolium pratense]|uniref:Uncharacterized protein n=1 Tax=Trifolium pratense TaxID=57577 RepID=A0ACB0MFU4_TRIPR|nr:unnamed protein product [Trifolium pratense]